ncbi:TPA: hypothetical protein MH593_26670 [Klebsiella pneumoniae]|nr:hypothetical protein [Klebsiella pneumoniae]HBX5952140.1 hypothetical protein [Klebsiella pneumoniae]
MSQIFFDTINNGQYDFMTEWDTVAMDIRTIFSAVWLMELVPERVIYAHYPEELEEARRLC